jgi:hypothetical protein
MHNAIDIHRSCVIAGGTPPPASRRIREMSRMMDRKENAARIVPRRARADAANRYLSVFDARLELRRDASREMFSLRHFRETSLTRGDRNEH